jgi:hypothetical protein
VAEAQRRAIRPRVRLIRGPEPPAPTRAAAARPPLEARTITVIKAVTKCREQHGRKAVPRKARHTTPPAGSKLRTFAGLECFQKYRAKFAEGKLRIRMSKVCHRGLHRADRNAPRSPALHAEMRRVPCDRGDHRVLPLPMHMGLRVQPCRRHSPRPRDWGAAIRPDLGQLMPRGRRPLPMRWRSARRLPASACARSIPPRAPQRCR